MLPGGLRPFTYEVASTIGHHVNFLAIHDVVFGCRLGRHLCNRNGPVPAQSADVVHLAGRVEQISLTRGEDQGILLAQFLPAIS